MNGSLGDSGSSSKLSRPSTGSLSKSLKPSSVQSLVLPAYDVDPPVYEDARSGSLPTRRSPGNAEVRAASVPTADEHAVPEALSLTTGAGAEDGRDALDDLVDRSSDLLRAASESLASVIELREHLRRFYAMDTACERNLLAHEHGMRRRLSSQTSEAAEESASASLTGARREKLSGAQTAGSPALPRLPSLMTVPISGEYASRPSLSPVNASSLSMTEARAQPDSRVGLPDHTATQRSLSTLASPERETDHDCSKSAASASVPGPRYTPAGLYSSWFTPAPAPSTTQLPAAKDVLSAIAGRQVSGEARDVRAEEVSHAFKGRHRRTEALPLGTSNDLARLPPHTIIVSPPAVVGRPTAVDLDPSSPPPLAVLPSRAHPHERRPSRQPSMSAESIARELVPRRDDTHAQRSATGLEPVTARERLMGALAGGT